VSTLFRGISVEDTPSWCVETIEVLESEISTGSVSSAGLSRDLMVARSVLLSPSGDVESAVNEGIHNSRKKIATRTAIPSNMAARLNIFCARSIFITIIFLTERILPLEQSHDRHTTRHVGEF